ncbi:hypothetical protein ANN_04562 [Periplaneta americana]|uniref:Uncharacterized protein n=1 Tax=Periplaneta americana TaxID=6978 RepID=A0ABQ8T8W2_PERAM|nr:hypothetical protein ANN_04562 [Periplaneta americana]
MGFRLSGNVAIHLLYFYSADHQVRDLSPNYISLNNEEAVAVCNMDGAPGRSILRNTLAGDNAGEMSPGSSTESYPAFARIGLRENPGKNLNQAYLLTTYDKIHYVFGLRASNLTSARSSSSALLQPSIGECYGDQDGMMMPEVGKRENPKEPPTATSATSFTTAYSYLSVPTTALKMATTQRSKRQPITPRQRGRSPEAYPHRRHIVTYLQTAFKEPGGSLSPTHKPAIGPILIEQD